jgi:phage terminase small subunit
MDDVFKIETRSVTRLGNKKPILCAPQAPVEAEPLPQNEPGVDETHANQYLIDPRQKVAWDSYINPKSKTFGNATQSAIEAGYGKSYAEHIGKKEWWCGKMRKLNLLGKGEEVLEEMLNMAADGAAMKRIKLDTAKFVLEHLGKDMGYSRRSELTGKDGGPIQISPEKKAEADEAIRKYLEGVRA